MIALLEALVTWRVSFAGSEAPLEGFTFTHAFRSTATVTGAGGGPSSTLAITTFGPSAHDSNVPLEYTETVLIQALVDGTLPDITAAETALKAAFQNDVEYRSGLRSIVNHRLVRPAELRQGRGGKELVLTWSAEATGF